MPRRDQNALAQSLLKKAAEDETALRELLDSEVSDAIFGFHAQQAVEKSVKAVLAARDIEYAWTHDIAFLLELLDEHGISGPPEPAEAGALTPWAAEFRYEDPPEAVALDRNEALRVVGEIRAWAAPLVEQAGAREKPADSPPAPPA